MDNPLVSVIIPVKDAERFLAEAISSVLGQDYRPLEIIVVDAQSSDRTREIAASFELVRIIPQVKQGLADAWNVGIDAADGDFIAFVSADDIWMPNKLSVQVNHMLDHPGIQYTIGRVKFFAEPGHRIPQGFRPGLLEGDHIGHMPETLVARRAVFDLVGTFDVSFRVGGDPDWFARAKDKDVPMAIMPDVLVLKRVHEANLLLASVEESQRDLLHALRRSIVRRRQRQSGEDTGANDAS